MRVAGKWAFRTAEDLSYLLERHAVEERRLSKAALETLAIIAYHQPVTRAEIEEIRGVETSKGTLDILLETGWIRPRGRRRAPGKPLTYGTTEAFLDHFALDAIKDLPGLAELKGAGLLDANLPPDFAVPVPTDVAKLMPDELPLEDEPDAQEELPLEDVPEAAASDEAAVSADDGTRRSECATTTRTALRVLWVAMALLGGVGGGAWAREAKAPAADIFTSLEAPPTLAEIATRAQRACEFSTSISMPTGAAAAVVAIKAVRRPGHGLSCRRRRRPRVGQRQGRRMGAPLRQPARFPGAHR